MARVEDPRYYATRALPSHHTIQSQIDDPKESIHEVASMQRKMTKRRREKK